MAIFLPYQRITKVIRASIVIIIIIIIIVTIIIIIIIIIIITIIIMIVLSYCIDIFIYLTLPCQVVYCLYCVVCRCSSATLVRSARFTSAQITWVWSARGRRSSSGTSCRVPERSRAPRAGRPSRAIYQHKTTRAKVPSHTYPDPSLKGLNPVGVVTGG